MQRSLRRDISSRPMIIIKNADQIAGIKESCKINIAVLDYIQEHIHEGMNTAEIDKIVYDMTTQYGWYSGAAALSRATRTACALR